jgi:hypothetical protein
MKTYKIQKNIPIPEKLKTECEYPFDEMEPGDSFICFDEAKVRYAAKKFGHKITIRHLRKEGTHAASPYRVWKL